MVTLVFTPEELQVLLNSIAGFPGFPGLAHRRLPGPVVFPLHTFVKRSREALADVRRQHEAAGTPEEKEALKGLEVAIDTPPIPEEMVRAMDGLTLTDLEILSMFFPPEEGE